MNEFRKTQFATFANPIFDAIRNMWSEFEGLVDMEQLKDFFIEYCWKLTMGDEELEKKMVDMIEQFGANIKGSKYRDYFAFGKKIDDIVRRAKDKFGNKFDDMLQRMAEKFVGNIIFKAGVNELDAIKITVRMVALLGYNVSFLRLMIIFMLDKKREDLVKMLESEFMQFSDWNKIHAIVDDARKYYKRLFV
jgi:hypothetical protein